MNKKNTLKLFTDFPKLYAGKDKSLMESLMPFGFECGDGWFNLIYELSDKLSKIDPECEALQVKEKFAGLRFYVTGTTEEGWKLIDEYEEKSYSTCEDCGDTKTAKLREGGWLVTLCDQCNEIKERTYTNN